MEYIKFIFGNTGYLSFGLGIIYLFLSLCGLIFVYHLIKKKSLEEKSLNKLIETGKWFVISVALVIGATIISDGFKERDQDLKEMEAFHKYVNTITKVEGVEQRYLLAEYFSIVAPNGGLKTAWQNYKIEVGKARNQFRNNKEKINELERKPSLTKAEIKEKEKLEQENEALNQQFISESNEESTAQIEERMIIAGGDKTIEEAQYELAKAKKISSVAQIYKKRNSYRTVIPNLFDKDEATKLLIEVREKINSGAYIVRKNKWCPNIEENDQYLICN